MVRIAFAAVLLWHPGFTENTAYTVLLASVTLASLVHVFITAITDGPATGFFHLAFVIPLTIMLWNQPWFTQHTVLLVHLVLVILGFFLTATVNAMDATQPATRSAMRRHARAYA